MSNGISSRESIVYGNEGLWGVTPTTAGVGKYLRFNTVNSANDKDTVKSGEVATAVEVADIIQTAQRGGLSIDTELSFTNLDDFLASIMANPWSANALTVGAVRQPLSIERQFADIGEFWTYKGSVVSTMSIAVAIGRAMTAKLTTKSKTLARGSSTAFSGGSFVAVNTNAVMDPISSLQLAQEGGAGSIAGLTELTMNISRGVIDMPQVGSVDPLDIQPAQLMASGTFSCYFADATYITKHLAHTTTSLSFTLGGPSNLKYNFLFSKVKLTIPDVPNGGPNNALIQQVQWEAFRDATNTTLKITRTP